MPKCDRAGTHFYKSVWYCLGHYRLIKILDSIDPDYLERVQRRPGPTEFKEKRDARV